jgi:AraC-like DNA-binding protein
MRDPLPVYLHLRRAKDLIDRDFAEPLDVPALAREAYASRAHFVHRSLGSFSSAFRQLVGESPFAYRRRWRERADVPAAK